MISFRAEVQTYIDQLLNRLEEFHQPDQEKQGGEGEEERRVEFRNRFHKIFFFRFLHRKWKQVYFVLTGSKAP